MPNLKEKLIKASLLHVRTCGFSQSAIMEGCHFLGLSSSAKEYLPSKEMDLIHYVLNDAYSKSLSRVSALINSNEMQFASGNQRNMGSLGLQERQYKILVKSGLEEYILALALYSEHWDDAMFQLAKPLNLKQSLFMLQGYTQNMQQIALSNTLSNDPESSKGYSNL